MEKQRIEVVSYSGLRKTKQSRRKPPQKGKGKKKIKSTA
jgi:hypothetical protein